MNIAITDCARPCTGISVYSNELNKNLKKLYRNNIKVFHKKTGLNHENIVNKYSSAIRSIGIDQIVLPYWLKKNDIDLLHQTKNYTLPLYYNGKSVVTIHDIIPYILRSQYLSSKIQYKYYEFLLNSTIKKSDKIITDSFFSKCELIKYFGVPQEKIEVVYLACNEMFNNKVDGIYKGKVLKKYNLNTPYILAIGGNEYRKNNERLMEIFRTGILKKHKLVIIGSNWHNENLENNMSNIFFTGRVSNDELVALYACADLFVFPSLYEGFGLPVLEAMSCGTAVITSNTTSLPEVAGDAALFFDPYDIVSMKNNIIKALENRELRKELVGKGYQQCKKFSWEQTAYETMEIYQKVLNK